MTARYENFGIRFLYPENWQIVDEQLDDWPRRVSVQSPQSGYWELHVYPARVDPGQLSDRVLEAMRSEYPDLECEPVAEPLWEARSVGYDLSFFCLDLLVTSRIRSLHLGHQTLLVICQAESREFDRQEAVFQAITRSLLDRKPE